MPFNSFSFLLLFLPVALAGYPLARRWAGPRGAQAWLLAASLVFYAWGRPSGLAYLGASILFNAGVARTMAADIGPGRRRWLILGLAGNLLFLGVLKYAGFAQATLEGLTGLHVPVPAIGLPLGVSFFTIQQIMYLVDCYEELAPPSGLLDHASFVAFFPCLSMGPLTRVRQMLPQLRAGGSAGPEAFAQGTLLLAMGLCKKALVAESLAALAGSGFAAPGSLSCLEAWIACLAYAFQIYFDFSGYTDMALGIGLMLGLRLPPNFQSPFKSLSIIEFWQRWHITLSQFITTYLYTPILRTFRRATLHTAALATLAAMAIAGLWHGPSWNFILFGLVHGLALVVNQYWRKKVRIRLPRPVGWALTLGVVTLAFVFFRSATLADAATMFRALLPGPRLLGLGVLKASRVGFTFQALIALIALPAAVLGPSSDEWAQRLRPSWTGAAAVAALFLVGLVYLNSSTAKDFIYFAF